MTRDQDLLPTNESTTHHQVQLRDAQLTGLTLQYVPGQVVRLLDLQSDAAAHLLHTSTTLHFIASVATPIAGQGHDDHLL